MQRTRFRFFAAASHCRAIYLPTLIAAILTSGASAGASSAGLPGGSRVMLELTGALVKPAQKNAPTGVIARPVPLSVYATADGDGWADVWAYEYDYNHRTHGGTVTRSRGTPD